MKKTISQEEFDKIYASHQLWLSDRKSGKRANLSNFDLREIEFPTNANLEHANLAFSNLSHVRLTRCNFFGADLSGANLSGADLSIANLSSAKLTETNVIGTRLDGTFLHGVIWAEEHSHLEQVELALGRLGSERMGLLAFNINDEQAVVNNENRIMTLTSKKKRLHENERRRKKSLSVAKGKELEQAFDLFEIVNEDVKGEMKRLQKLSAFYLSMAAVLFSTLLYAWWNYYATLSNGLMSVETYTQEANASWYLIPSLLLLTLLVAVLVRLHSSQIQVVRLKTYSNRTKQLLAMLQSYVKLVDDTKKVEAKIKEVLDVFVDYLMYENYSAAFEQGLDSIDLSLPSNGFIPSAEAFMVQMTTSPGGMHK